MASSGLSSLWAAQKNQNASVLPTTLPMAVSTSMRMGGSIPVVSVGENMVLSLVAPDVSALSTVSSARDSAISDPRFLLYKDFSSTILHRTPFSDATPLEIEIYNRIITPYNAEAFAKLLAECGLSEKYPLLVNNLISGFPIGDMPPLTETVIIPNHPSIIEHLESVYDYINTELEAKRMSGPFTQAEAEHVLGGPFYCSPFVVVKQDQGPDLPLKVRICRHLSKDARNMGSVNSFVDKEDFPTRFDMPSRVADAVSLCVIFDPYHPLYPIFHIIHYNINIPISIWL